MQTHQGTNTAASNTPRERRTQHQRWWHVFVLLDRRRMETLRG